MTIGIYGIFDTKTNQCLYVGQSKDVEARFRTHVTKLKCKRSSALKSFILWYHANGSDESILTFKILEESPNDDYTKNVLEAKWFDSLQPKFYGKVPSLSERWQHSEETKLKIAEAIRNKNGNLSGINKKQKDNCKICKKICFAQKSICIDCQKFLFRKNFSRRWKLIIFREYLENNLAIREISRKYNISTREISRLLKIENIEIKKRSFNGRAHTAETLKKISQNSKIHAQKHIKNRIKKECENNECKTVTTYKPSDVKRFCSRRCYIKFQSKFTIDDVNIYLHKNYKITEIATLLGVSSQAVRHKINNAS
jgi:transposase-like protein